MLIGLQEWELCLGNDQQELKKQLEEGRGPRAHRRLREVDTKVGHGWSKV